MPVRKTIVDGAKAAASAESLRLGASGTNIILELHCTAKAAAHNFTKNKT